MMKIKVILLICVFTLPIRGGAETVKTEKVTDSSLVANFFYKDGDSKRLGILMLGGSEGGIRDPRLAQLLAENGYAVFCPAYFAASGLPDSLEEIPLEYLDKAIAWMHSNDRIQPGGIVVIGSSKGAELALLLASRDARIRGVVAQAPSSVVWQGLPKSYWPPSPPKSSWSFDGKPLAYVPLDGGKNYDPKDPMMIYKTYVRSLTQKDAVEKAAIEVEKIHGPVLLLSGQEDHLWPSQQMGEAICGRLKANEFKYKFEQVVYKDAGHTLNEFYMIGGTFQGNKDARIASTQKILDFLKAMQ